MKFLSFMIMVAYILVSSLRISIANDSMNVLQSMSDGVSLVSKGGKFEFGFFSPGYSQKRYVGIWYKNIPIQTVVWVANKANPINDSSGIITLNSTGNLVLTQNAYLVWYTNNSHKQAQNPVVVLLDSGNLVIKNEEETDPEVCLWQSFDYPSDTLLPGMKLGRNIRTGHEWKLTSWENPNDPSPGDIYRVLELYNYPELYVMKGKKKVYRSGPWNGLYFSGLPYLQNNTIFGYNFVSNKDEIYFTFSLLNNFVIERTVVNQTGIVYRYVWLEGDHNWTMHRSYPKEFCDNYGLCGAYGNCIINQTQGCQCLKGFSPKSPQAWASSDWSQGCVRNKPLSCNGEHKDGFVKFEGLKVPDTTQTWLDKTIGLEECRVKCLNNCSCMAYSNSDIRGAGSGCVMWYGDLIDMRQFETGGQGLHIRMSASESVTNYSKDKSEKDIDLPTFDFSFISNATNDFSQSEKLGQGGFGSVYKGILPDGQEIAVKRLSKTSGQGLDEFKNEVMLIAKLQHRNLVKLLGCSIQQDEKLLIYEFMPNRSLDYFIFDSTRHTLLGWTKRFEIIGGIARGLLYLHQDSRLKIIHRDLKTSNVLLDSNMNPKISDFGMARTFGLDQDEANTNRVMGTYGYMPPEYVVHGSFSVKSDVFSFGVIVLEIISGKKNRAFYDPHHHLNLLGHAWRLWIEKRPTELMDDLVDNSACPSEIIRYIHIGLLCVQQRPEDRPNMSSVTLFLNGEKLLPEPNQPGFYTGKAHPTKPNSSSRNIDVYSFNEMSNSLLEPR
ncbi:G-type lectin S-receptor-like serine/threonine-protein kinase isoform B [Glycine soja]|uniref:Receptor-like serine/threonine-protein kinase n=1 Tax=Glycine soja TaxID=3848 RepID=A0A445HPX5_GLYSO|nr:G-type lectin S-receptor-like serine/threonine-protein kinase isoform B [Glycine soja]